MNLRKTIAAGTGALLAVSSVGAGVGSAFLGNDAVDQSHEAQSNIAVEEQVVLSDKTDIVTLDVVKGTFAFSQSAINTNEEIAHNMAAAQYICGGQTVGADESVAPEEWQISVDGAVNNPYTATFQQFVESEQVQQILMGCSCAGNPTDGRASINAEVTGISLLTMLDIAGIDKDANTVVVTSADGYEVALPLSYVTNRYCPVVFDINGAPIAESMGGANQLWLGSTSANYFARNLVAITVENRQTPPADPMTEEAQSAYQNLPNIGILLGGEVD